MKRQTTVRLEDVDLTIIDTEAREAGMNRADYLRAIILRRPTQNVATDARMEARLSRLEQMLACTLMSAWETQVLTRGSLTDERFARVKKIGIEHAARWRISGLDLDNMLPKTEKERADE